MSFVRVSALCLSSLSASAAPSDVQLDTLVRFEASLAGEPLTVAELTDLRAATVEMFNNNPALAEKRLARATAALAHPLPGRLALAMRALDLAEFNAYADSDARIVKILAPHADHAAAVPPPAPSAPRPAVAPAPSPAPPPAPVVAASPDPTEAQYANIIAIAEWTVGSAFTDDEKSQVRRAILRANAHPTFRQTTIDVPATDVGALYRLPPDAQARAREDAIFGRSGLFLAALDLPGFPDPDRDYARLAQAILDAYVRIAALTPPTEAQYAQSVAGIEAVIGGRLLPDEAASVRAAIRAMLAERAKDGVQLLCGAHALIAWSADSTPDDRANLLRPMLREMREAVTAGTLFGKKASPELIAAASAILAAHARANPAAPGKP